MNKAAPGSACNRLNRPVDSVRWLYSYLLSSTDTLQLNHSSVITHSERVVTGRTLYTDWLLEVSKSLWEALSAVTRSVQLEPMWVVLCLCVRVQPCHFLSRQLGRF